MLKIKPTKDGEGEVIGYVAGKPGKTGALEGKIGSLVVIWNDKVFELAGMEHGIRGFDNPKVTDWAIRNPGKRMPHDANGTCLPMHCMVTFEYRSLTDDGKPKEARFKGKREM